MTSAEQPMESGQQPPLLVHAPPGPESRALALRHRATECPALDARRAKRSETSGVDQSPVFYARGLGSNVWDADGNRYVDMVSGFGALPFGHCDAGVVAADREQRSKLELALGDVYASEPKVVLCEKLVALFPEPGARVILGLSGADAVTAALKSAVLSTGNPRVLAFEGGYHGLSHGPLSVCGLSAGFREPFVGQMGAHAEFLPYPRDDAAASRALQAIAGGGFGAVIIEPLLGRGGCVAPRPGFLRELGRTCKEVGTLLIADEIWTGLGRSGSLLLSAEEGASPDLVCLGKSLGGGHAVSACVGAERVMEAWGRFGGTTIHTATYFGEPVGAHVATYTLDRILRDRLAERAHAVGERLLASLMRDIAPCVRDVRGRGLMVGIEFETAREALRVMRSLLGRGYITLTGGSAGNVLTLTPSLCIGEPLLEAFAVAFQAAARERMD